MSKKTQPYEASHFLATLAASAIVGVPVLVFAAASTEWAGSLMLVLLAIVFIIGVPTEYFWVSRMREPTLARAYGAYLVTGTLGTLVALIIGWFYTNGYSGFSGILLFIIGGFFLLGYVPAMLIARGIYGPLQRAIGKKLDDQQNPQV